MEKDIKQDTGSERGLNKETDAQTSVLDVLKDSQGLYLLKRSEKIAKACFLITQHISDTLLIKQKTRNSALEILAKTSKLVGGLTGSAKDIDESAKELVLEIMSLISLSDIATSDRLISEPNYKIVTEQSLRFVNEVHEYIRHSDEKAQVVPLSLFDMSDTDMERAAYDSRTSIDTPKSSSLQKDIPFSYNFSHKNTRVSKVPKSLHSNTTKGALSTSSSFALVTTHANHGVSHNTDQAEGNKNERQQLIIQTIKSRGDSSIKDLTDIIKGCSEKTVQRELISLVHAGILAKTGERRWSRYSIV